MIPIDHLHVVHEHSQYLIASKPVFRGIVQPNLLMRTNNLSHFLAVINCIKLTNSGGDAGLAARHSSTLSHEDVAEAAVNECAP